MDHKILYKCYKNYVYYSLHIRSILNVSTGFESNVTGYFIIEYQWPYVKSSKRRILTSSQYTCVVVWIFLFYVNSFFLYQLRETLEYKFYLYIRMGTLSCSPLPEFKYLSSLFRKKEYEKGGGGWVFQRLTVHWVSYLTFFVSLKDWLVLEKDYIFPFPNV